MKFLHSLFKKAPPARSFHGLPGKRLYAIGDIHGCYAAFDRLLDRIESDNAARPAKDVSVICLGDLIDRGPDSRQVIERMISLTRTPSFAGFHSLIGNHEEMLIKAWDGDAEAAGAWVNYGGRECLESYGVDRMHLRDRDGESIALTIHNAVPEAHIDFLRSLYDSVDFGDYLLVHAGVNPKKPLDEQSRRSFLWIREPFLSWDKPLEKRIIHGHTITDGPDIKPHRIGIDTGAYNGGPLTALRIEDDETDFISVD